MDYKGTYAFWVDWNNNGFFGDANEDVTAYVRRAIGDRGRDKPFGPFKPGVSSIVLNNADGRFSPEDPASPLYPDVDTGRKVKITCTYGGVTYTKYVGRLDKPDVNTKSKTVVLRCLDEWGRMGDTEISTPLYQDTTMDYVIGQILDRAGFTEGRTLDPGLDRIAYIGFTQRMGRDAIQETADSEGADPFVAADGGFRLENRHHRLLHHATAAATFPNVFEDAVSTGDVRDVVNRAEVSAHPQELGDATVVWALRSPFPLLAGETRAFQVTYSGLVLVPATSTAHWVPPDTVFAPGWESGDIKGTAVGQSFTMPGDADRWVLDAVLRSPQLSSMGGHLDYVYQFRFEVYAVDGAGVPYGMPLCYSPWAGSTLLPEDWTGYSWAYDYRLRGGQAYCFIVRTTYNNGYPHATNQVMQVGGKSAGAYPGGQAWVANATGTGWLKPDSWVAQPTYDLCFSLAARTSRLAVKANAASNGSGVDLSPRVTCLMEGEAGGAMLTVTNGNAQLAYVNGLQISGRPVTSQASPHLVEEAASRAKYGLRPYRASPAFCGSDETAQALADQKVERLAIRPNVLSVSFNANKSELLLVQAQTREISDRVHLQIDKLGVDADYYIEAVHWEIDGQNKLEWVTWTMSKAPADESLFHVGVTTFRQAAQAAF